jgi:hypothetical protein
MTNIKTEKLELTPYQIERIAELFRDELDRYTDRVDRWDTEVTFLEGMVTFFESKLSQEYQDYFNGIYLK